MKTLSLTMAVCLGLPCALLAGPRTRWSSYKSNLLNVQVSVPSDWQPLKATKMLAFRYDDLAGGTGGIGILKSTKIDSIEKAAERELEVEGHPPDWKRFNARVGGMRAIKITGTDRHDSSKHFVHYYVETPRGVYIVQCTGSADRWAAFSPTFATILSKLAFL